MRTILVLLVIVVLIGIFAIERGYIDIRQTRTASLPSVSVKGGTAPTYDIRTANVSVGQESKVVTVPTVDVQKPSGTDNPPH